MYKKEFHRGQLLHNCAGMAFRLLILHLYFSMVWWMQKKTLKKKDTENSATCFCSWSGKTFQLIAQVSYRGI